MLHIARLHTADSNVQVFDTALQELGTEGVRLRHGVRTDLLAATEQAGGLTSEIAEQTAGMLRDQCGDANAVPLTC